MDKIRNLKRRLIAVFFAFIALFHFRNNDEGLSWKKVITALASPLAIFSSCTTDPDEPPEAAAPVINNITVSGAGSPDADGTYTVAYNAEITLSGNPAVEGGVYAWTYTTDPADKTLNFDQTAASPTISGFEKGVTYTFELVVTKNGKTSEKKSVTIAVKENAGPTANAGVTGGTLVNDRYEFDFTSPDNRTIQLNSNGSSDTDGTIEYAWTCTDKPDEADMPTFDSTAQNPAVSGFNKLGNYEFTLKVTDNDGEESEVAVVKVSLYRTASANITIPDKTFEPGTELDFSVNYGTIDPIFAGRITYKISDGTNTIADTSTNPSFNGRVYPKNEYDGELTVFTQVFYYDGNKITPEKSRSVTVMTCGPQFSLFFEENAAPDYMSATTPELSISLSEKVSEGNIQ